MRRLIFIVAPDQESLYQSLLRTFESDDMVQILKDRRKSERRRGERASSAERRTRQRRRRGDIQERLRLHGYAVVSILAVKP